MQRTVLSSRQGLGRCAPLPVRPPPRGGRLLVQPAATKHSEEAFRVPESWVGVVGALTLFFSAGSAFAETDLSSLLEKRYADVQGKPVEAPKRIRTVSTPAVSAPPPAAATPKPTTASKPTPPPAPKPASAPAAPKATPAPTPAAPVAAAKAAAPATASAASTPVLAGAGAVVVAALGALGLSGNKKEKVEAEAAPVGKKITKAVPVNPKLAAKAPAGTKITGKSVPTPATKIITKGPVGTKITGKTSPVIKAVPTKKAALTPATAKVVKAPAPPPKKAPIGTRVVGTKVVGTKITGKPQPVGTKIVGARGAGTKVVGPKGAGTKVVGGTKITKAAAPPKPSYEEDDGAKTGLLGGLFAVALLLGAGITLNTKPVPSKAPETKLSEPEKELVSLLAQPKVPVAPSVPAPTLAATPAPIAKIVEAPAPKPAPVAPPAPAPVAKVAEAPVVTPPAPVAKVAEAPVVPPPAPVAKVAEAPVIPPPAPKVQTPTPAPPKAEVSISDMLKSAAATPAPQAAPATPAAAPVATAAAAPSSPTSSQAPLLIGLSVAVLVAGGVYAASQSSTPEAAAAPAAAPPVAPVPASTLVLSEEDKNKLREVYRRLFKNENFRKLWTAILSSSGLTIKEEEFEQQLLEGPLFDQLLPAILKELPAEKVSALLALKDDASIASLEAALSEVKVDEAAVAKAAQEVTQEVKQSLGSA